MSAEAEAAPVVAEVDEENEVEKETPAPKKASAKKEKAAKTPATGPLRSSGRERKGPTEFYKVETPKEKPKLEVKKGEGERLRDIPNVCFQLTKLKPEDDVVTALHALFYHKPGTRLQRKKMVLDFSGLTYTGASEEEKDRARLLKLKVEDLNRLLDIFGLARGGSKEDSTKEGKARRVHEFLKKPHAIGPQDLEAREAAKKKEGAAEKKRKAEDGGEGTAKKAKKASGGKKKEAEEEAAAGEPLSEEETAAVKDFLASADRDSVTVKSVLAHLRDKFGAAIDAKKASVKELALEIIAEKGEAEEGEKEEEGGEEEKEEEKEEAGEEEGEGEAEAAEAEGEGEAEGGDE